MNAFKALWRRAPLWQLCFLLAGIGTLLCALLPFYPSASPLKPPAKLLDDGNYISHVRSGQGSNASKSSSQVQASSLSLATMGTTDIPAERHLSGSVRVIGFNIKLPTGDWVLLANQAIKLPQSSGMTYFLGKVEGKRLIGGVRLFAIRSNDSASAELTPLRGCQPDDAGLIHVDVDPAFPGGSRGCWTMSNLFTSDFQHWADRAVNMPSIDRAAAGELAAKGISYPQDLISVRMARSEPWGLLDVYYLFSPDAEGIRSTPAISYRDSDWHASNRKRTPEQEAYVEKVKRWGVTHWGKFKHDFMDSR